MIQPEAIIVAVRDHFGIIRSEMMGKSRMQTTVLARHVAMYLVREMTGRSSSEIGRIFGRDHTTVLLGVKRVAERMETDVALCALVADIRHGLVCARVA